MSTSTTHADPPAPFSWWVVGELRAEMARRRVSGREVARRIGRPAATVDKWLSGRSSLTLDHLTSFPSA